MSFARRFTGLLAFSLLFLSIGSCGTRTVKSTVSTSTGARTVRATVDGGASITTKDDTAFVSFRSHKIAVEDDRLLFDGEEQVQFSADAKRVEISVANGQMTATVDGKLVLELSFD
jgi:hypothetical protein